MNTCHSKYIHRMVPCIVDYTDIVYYCSEAVNIEIRCLKSGLMKSRHMFRVLLMITIYYVVRELRMGNVWAYLTHSGRVTHTCVSDLTSIGSDNGLSPGRRHAIIRTNAGVLLMRPLGTNFSDFLVKIPIFSFKKMRLKVSSAKRRPFCLGLNEFF